MSYHCPACQRKIFNRRLERCEFCDADIPANLRYTAEEIAIRDKRIAETEERWKKNKVQEEEEARRLRERSLDLDPPSIM